MRIFFHANLARLRPIQLLSKMEKWDLRTELDWNSKFDFTLIRISFLYKTTKRLFCSYETFSIWLRSPLQYFKSYFFFFFQRRASTRSQIAFQSVDSNRGVWIRWILEHLIEWHCDIRESHEGSKLSLSPRPQWDSQDPRGHLTCSRLQDR